MFDGVVVMVVVVAAVVVWIVDAFQWISLSTIGVISIREKAPKTSLLLYLGKTKINENTWTPLIAVKEVVWFHVPMNNLSCMKMTETCQEGTHVATDIICCHFAVYILMIWKWAKDTPSLTAAATVTNPEIFMFDKWHHDEKFFSLTKGSDQRRYTRTSTGSLGCVCACKFPNSFKTHKRCIPKIL